MRRMATLPGSAHSVACVSWLYCSLEPGAKDSGISRENVDLAAQSSVTNQCTLCTGFVYGDDHCASDDTPEAGAPTWRYADYRRASMRAWRGHIG